MTEYKKAPAFRQALEERLRKQAAGESQLVQRWRRRIAFERFLARLDGQGSHAWTLKGGMAMEARLGIRARTTRDVDLGFPSPRLAHSNNSVEQAVESFRDAASRDLRDHFAFEIRRPAKLPIPGAEILRLTVDAQIASRQFESLSVDVALDEKLLAPPETVEGSRLLAFAGIPPVRLRLVSKAQHFAEKILGITKAWEGRQNTRVKDLVDLILLMELGLPAPKELRSVVVEAFARERSAAPPRELPKPPMAWSVSYPSLAVEVGLKENTVEAAFARISAAWSALMHEGTGHEV